MRLAHVYPSQNTSIYVFLSTRWLNKNEAVMIEETRTVFWENGQVCMIDQRILPGKFEINRYTTVHEAAEAIQTMVVRCAPALGASAGFRTAFSAQNKPANTVAR